MASEDYLREVTIGNLAELSGKIILQEYNPRWEQMFRQQEERIKQALKGKQIHIEHVGSTSVPGLCAKPVIDILLLVEDSSDEDSYAVQLQDRADIISEYGSLNGLRTGCSKAKTRK